MMDDGKKGDVDQQKERQKILITHLKQQLEDLEKYAYESGEGDLPSAEVMARQVCFTTSVQFIQCKMTSYIIHFIFPRSIVLLVIKRFFLLLPC